MLQKVITLLVFVMMTVTTAQAQERVEQPVGSRCLTAGVPQLFVSIMLGNQQPDTADAAFAVRLAELEAVAKAAKVDKFLLQAANYNLYATGDGQWQLNGSVAFDAPAKGCRELVAKLKEKGFAVGLNALADKPEMCQ